MSSNSGLEAGRSKGFVIAQVKSDNSASEDLTHWLNRQYANKALSHSNAGESASRVDHMK
jgi:hypothetical protein